VRRNGISTYELAILPIPILELLGSAGIKDAFAMLFPIHPLPIITIPTGKDKLPLPMFLAKRILSLINCSIFPHKLASAMHLAIRPLPRVSGLVGEDDLAVAVGGEPNLVDLAGVDLTIRVADSRGAGFVGVVDRAGDGTTDLGGLGSGGRLGGS
jgi:hypothetical protein